MKETELKSTQKIDKYNRNRIERLAQTPATNSHKRDTFLTSAAAGSRMGDSMSQSQTNFNTYRGEVLDLKDKLAAQKLTQQYQQAKRELSEV